MKADPGKGEALGELMKRASLSDLEGDGVGRYGSSYEDAQANAHPTKKDHAAEHSMHAFGAHLCKVHVDSDLGAVRVTRWVGMHAAGRLLNSKTARSQIFGGIKGIVAALMEQTVRDPNLARYATGRRL